MAIFPALGGGAIFLFDTMIEKKSTNMAFYDSMTMGASLLACKVGESILEAKIVD